jgi:hypothetical protein
VDVATALPDDPCPRCGAPLVVDRGVVVGRRAAEGVAEVREGRSGAARDVAFGEVAGVVGR